ncbi:YdcF family protein [Bacillus manliponensis]|uniref:YdcF family protein n=1 Tax=Bacillus manliponensis TaxID=574376 RepID=UPI00351702DF
MNVKKKRKRVLQALLFIVGAMVLFVTYAAYDIWQYREKTDDVTTDAAVVLGAASWNGKPSPVFRERINHAISLYKEGTVNKIIFTGGTKFAEEPEEAITARAYALENDVKPEDILIETESLFTEENLRNAFQVGNTHGLQTYTIVSDPLHMKRSMQIAKHIGMDAYASPTPTSAYKTLDTKVPFFVKEICSYVGYMASLPVRFIKGEYV